MNARSTGQLSVEGSAVKTQLAPTAVLWLARPATEPVAQETVLVSSARAAAGGLSMSPSPTLGWFWASVTQCQHGSLLREDPPSAWEGSASCSLALHVCQMVAPPPDIDECQAPGACGEKRCENTLGSYHCVATCQMGYQATAAGDCIGEDICGVRAVGRRSLTVVTSAT